MDSSPLLAYGDGSGVSLTVVVAVLLGIPIAGAVIYAVLSWALRDRRASRERRQGRRP